MIPPPTLEHGIQYFIKSDYVSAVDIFSRAIVIEEQNGSSANKEILFDLHEKLSTSAERAELYPIAVSSAVRMTEIFPRFSTGYKQLIRVLKKQGRLIDAENVLFEANELGVYGVIERSEKSLFVRADPCEVFPFEILRIIFSYLTIKEWTNLQIVSASWHKYLTGDPFLWAERIDFSVFNPPRCNERALRKCLDLIFLKKPSVERTSVRTVKYLGLGPFTSASEEERCLEMLEMYRFAYFGKIKEICVHSNFLEHAKYLYELTPVNRFTIYTEKSVFLDKLLEEQPKLELLSINNHKAILGFEDEEDIKYSKKKKYPLKILDVSGILLNNTLLYLSSVCPYLETLNIDHNGWPVFDIVFLCMVLRMSKIKTLNISLKIGTSIGSISQRIITPPEKSIPEWPHNLTTLSLQKVNMPNLEILSGSLTGLETLDLSDSKLDLISFLDRFQIGKNIKTLILKRFKSSTLDMKDILSRCLKIEVFSLYDSKSFKINIWELPEVLNTTQLRKIDVGKTRCYSFALNMVGRLVDCGVRKIGCEDIRISIEECDLISRSGVELSFKELSLDNMPPAAGLCPDP